MVSYQRELIQEFHSIGLHAGICRQLYLWLLLKDNLADITSAAKLLRINCLLILVSLQRKLPFSDLGI
jgi:hypothetical protein